MRVGTRQSLTIPMEFRGNRKNLPLRGCVLRSFAAQAYLTRGGRPSRRLPIFFAAPDLFGNVPRIPGFSGNPGNLRARARARASGGSHAVSGRKRR
jgi:hypothetical protein